MAYKTVVSAAVLAESLDDDRWLVFDCRFDLSKPQAGRLAYQKSHIPGAFYVDLNKDLAGAHRADSGRHPLPDAATLAEKLRGWGVCDDSQLLIYDDAHGAIAARMWWLLCWLGHGQAAVLDGGYQRWQQLAYPREQQQPAKPDRGDFHEKPDDSMWVDVGRVESLLGRDDFALIDARHPHRYSGAKETIDSEGGHIPGAVNHFFMNNIDAESGCFLPAERLRALHTPLLKPTTIHSCGSGVTACHNLLAMRIAGLPMSPLYVGSWSEWIRDPLRPRSQSS